jgi:hypothetical protein
MEQQINIKFCFKLSKTLIETCLSSHTAYGNEVQVVAVYLNDLNNLKKGLKDHYSDPRCECLE